MKNKQVGDGYLYLKVPPKALTLESLSLFVVAVA